MRISPKARRELFWILLSAVCFPLVYLLIRGDAGVMAMERYRQDLQLLQMENSRLREQHRRYLERINRIKSDPYEMERIARERYNFARPGDIIVHIPEP